MLILLGGACGDDAGPPTMVLPGQLNILRQRVGGPPLEQYTGSFWAVKGTSRTLEIDYVSLEPDGTGEDFLRVDVPSDALLLRSDGQPFEPGDSVLITVVIDPELLLIRFEPSGLTFNSDDPVRLRIDYAETDDDLNGDGVVDGKDAAIKELELGLWRQSRTDAVWERIGSAHFKDLEEFEGELFRFSNYALGW
jgi:hypothetical protein